MTKTKELSTTVSKEVLAQLNEAYPVEQGYNRISLPRLGMYSQDQTEGKGKAMKVISEAGTFYTEKQTDDIDEETGKKVWNREEIGTDVEAIIVYQRKQLKMYDEATEKYTSSPIYDDENEVLKLWCDKQEVASGTPEELKKKYQYTDEKTGKIKSHLEENRILYVLLNDELYQLNLRGSSMYSFLKYRRNVLPISCVTRMSSESKEKGSIEWNQMTFEKVRDITAKEGDMVLSKIREIKTAIGMEKAQFSENVEIIKAKNLDKFAEEVEADEIDIG
jgi:hypothetical protein